MSITVDEEHHVAYGLKVLRGHPDRGAFFDSQMPISALNAMPHFIADHLQAHRVLPRLAALLRRWQLGRASSVVALLLLDVVIFWWSYTLYGWAAGLAAVVMALLSPNLIAHGTLATTDGYFALSVLLALYSLRRYLLNPTVVNACVSGCALAVAQTTKPFAIYLYAIAGMFLVLAVLRRDPTRPSLTPSSVLAYTLIGAVWFLVVINVVYSFDRSLTRLQSYHFQSAPFRHLQEIVEQTPGLWRLRVPVPYPFLQGLDMTKAGEANGSSYGNVYLLGMLRDGADPLFHGFKSYFAIAYLFKEPIALQALFLMGLLWICRKRTWKELLYGEGLLLVAAGFLVVWFSFFDKAQIGIRHLLPALAIEVVIASAMFAGAASMSRARRGALALLVAWLGISTLSYFPHMIPYMNELLLDRRFGYKILADSNLDWGQNAELVERFVRQNPDVILDPVQPVCGRVLMSANQLVGVIPKSQGGPSWAIRYQPIAHIGYAHLLFHIPPNAAGGAGSACSRQRPGA